MREYVLFVILIFIPIGLALHYFLRREGLPKKDTSIILLLALLIIFTFPICMARLGIYLSMLIYVMVISALVVYLLRLGESGYLEKAFASLRTLRQRADFMREPDLSGLTYEEAANLLLGSLENTTRQMLEPVPEAESNKTAVSFIPDEVQADEAEEVTVTARTGDEEVRGMTADVAEVDSGLTVRTMDVIEEAATRGLSLEDQSAVVTSEESSSESEAEKPEIREEFIAEEKTGSLSEEPAIVIAEAVEDGEEIPAEAEAAAGIDVEETFEDTAIEVVEEAEEPTGETMETIAWNEEIQDAAVIVAAGMMSEEAEPDVLAPSDEEMVIGGGENQPVEEIDEEPVEAAPVIVEVGEQYDASFEPEEPPGNIEVNPMDEESTIDDGQSADDLGKEPVELAAMQAEAEEEYHEYSEATDSEEVIGAAEEVTGSAITEAKPAEEPPGLPGVESAEIIETPLEEERELPLEGAEQEVLIETVPAEETAEDTVVADRLEVQLEEAGPEAAPEECEEIIDEIPAGDLATDSIDHYMKEPIEKLERSAEAPVAPGKITEPQEADEALAIANEITAENLEGVLDSLPAAWSEPAPEVTVEEVYELAEETEPSGDSNDTVAETLTIGGDSPHPLAFEEISEPVPGPDMIIETSPVEKTGILPEPEEEPETFADQDQEEEAGQKAAERADTMVEQAEIIRWIDEGFRCKARSDLPAAIYAFVQAWNGVEDAELRYLITLELVELYKECGYYNYAEQVLGNYLELGGHKSDIIYEINRQLDAVRFLATELTRLGMSGAPWAQVPRWIRMELEDALNQ